MICMIKDEYNYNELKELVKLLSFEGFSLKYVLHGNGGGCPKSVF